MGIDFVSTPAMLDAAVRHALTVAWEPLSRFGIETDQQGNLFAYFKALDDVLASLKASDRTGPAAAAMSHVDDLAERAGCDSTVILAGAPFIADRQTILNVLADISSVLHAAAAAHDIAAELRCAAADPASELGRALTSARLALTGFGIEVSGSADLFAYFKSLGDGFGVLAETGGVDAVAAVMIHVDYLANKAGCGSAVILGGADFSTEPEVIRDALLNIGDVLRAMPRAEKPEGDHDPIAPDLVAPETDAVLNDAVAFAWQTLGRFNVAVPYPADLFAYFASLNGFLTGPGATARLDSVIVHVNYLADKAGCTAAFILGGGHFSADRQVILDALANIGAALQTEPCPDGVPNRVAALIVEAEAKIAGWCVGERPLVVARTVLHERPLTSAEIGFFETHLSAGSAPHVQPEPVQRPEPSPEGIPDAVFALILKAEARLAGWCSREKALVIARTVLLERPKICVEIGIFGGRSLVPCAAALQHNGTGAIYGIEAWSPSVAIEQVTNEVNDEWWSKVDFAGIKRDFYRFVAEQNLTPHVRVIESPSGRAAVLFDQIDFLHIDGSHSVINAAEDVLLYARKVRSGGIVVFDDVNWQSTAPARDLLAALCDTVTVLKDPESGLDICAVMRRR